MCYILLYYFVKDNNYSTLLDLTSHPSPRGGSVVMMPPGGAWNSRHHGSAQFATCIRHFAASVSVCGLLSAKIPL